MNERKGYGQFHPRDEQAAYLLYDGPSEWGVRVGMDGSVDIGGAATIEGEYPHYVVSLPSGMRAFVSPDTTADVDGGGYRARVSSGRVDLAEAIRDALVRDARR